MKRLSNFKWSILVLVLHLLAMGYYAITLPFDAGIPTHWNINNEIDGYSGKTGGIILWTATCLIMFLMLYLMPWYSPWYKKYEKRFERLMPPLCLVMVLFLSLIGNYSLYLAKTGIQPQIQFILILIGLMFIFLGNLMPKTPRNFFIGIKTPWTLASDEVWQRSHRLGGKLFAVSGVIMIIKGFVLPQHNMFQQLSGALAMLILLYPLLYSFILFRKLGLDKK